MTDPPFAALGLSGTTELTFEFGDWVEAMTVARDRPTQQTALSVDAFLAHYGDSNRYELIDGAGFNL